jgi:hypothetical protein
MMPAVNWLLPGTFSCFMIVSTRRDMVLSPRPSRYLIAPLDRLRYIHAQQSYPGEEVIEMSGGFLPRMDIFAVNWIVRRIGIGATLVAMVVAVIAIAAGLYATKHGTPLASGLIWVKH